MYRRKLFVRPRRKTKEKINALKKNLKILEVEYLCMMEPDIFLGQEDIPLLVQALTTFALEADAATDRKETLINAGIHLSFLSKLIFETSPYLFSNKLVAHFRGYQVLAQQFRYHPMVSLLEYLLKVHELEDQDRAFFERLIRQGQENFSGLMARSAVGRIESPVGTAMGTGVLIDRQLLLTCRHVFEQISDEGLDQAWVRFDYKPGRYGTGLGETCELDAKGITKHEAQIDQALDYVLIKIIGKPRKHYVRLSHDWLRTGQNIRLVHHPRGEPVQISDVGQVVHVDEEYIQHNIPTDYGSSGGAIFDMNWRLVAIHRGVLNLSRPAPPGITEGVPIYSIWDELKPHLSS
jgi:hypothetical protein